MITEIFADKPFRPGGGERDRRQCDQPVAELGHQVMMVKIMMMMVIISVITTMMKIMMMIKIISVMMMMVKIMVMMVIISVMMTMAMMIMIKIIMLLIIRAEERHKLVTASLNFYKTAEQVPTLPTISFPSLLSTSSYHHRAGANHHHCHHHHHHHVKVCSVLDSLEREYKREDDWLSRHVVMICIISLLSSADHHHHGNN